MRIPGKREAAPLEKRRLDILPGTNSDHGAGDLRVVREAAAEMASKLIRKVSDKNDTDAFRRVERDIISVFVNIGTVQLQLDDNGIKLRAICLKHYIAAFRRSERRGRNAISKRAFALSVLWELCFQLLRQRQDTQQQQHEPTPKLALSLSLSLLSFPPPKSNNFYQSRE